MSAPVTFRLDTLAVHLVARLEATRRAHLDDPAAARDAFARVVGESAAALAQECRDVLGDQVQAAYLEREAHATFLPRYTRMALAQNQIESRGYGFAGSDGPVTRVLATLVAFAFAAFMARFAPGQAKAMLFLLAALTPFVPELRRWWVRRGWTAQLQELADDLGRAQDAAAALPVAEPSTSPQPEPPPRARAREEAR